MNFSRIIKQSDPRWADVQLGNGRRTIAQAGCLLACLVMAANELRDSDTGIVEAGEKIANLKGFVGSGLVFDVAAAALGLSTVYVGKYNAADAMASLGLGGLVILGIDYKDGKSSALSDADHFVLAVGIDGATGSWVVADPAVGGLSRIPQTEKTIYRGPHAEICEMRVVAKDVGYV